MTSRERLLATYAGQETDRLPYWAKVANSTWQLSQPTPVREWAPIELLDYIHADGIFYAPRPVVVSRPRVEIETSRDGNVRTKITRTPDGDLTERWTVDPSTGSWHPTEFPVKTINDVKRLRWAHTDVTAEPEDEGIAEGRRLLAELGEHGILSTSWGTSPLMDLVQHIIGPVGTHLMLHDYPAELDELIELMHQSCLIRVREIARHTPTDLVVSVENTSTTLISPHQFSTYCLRHLCDYGRAIEAEGKMHELHMCGLTRTLLPEIDTIPASSIEAYTSPKLGNTRLCHGRADAPSKTLVGGTNVNVWLWPLDRIKQYIREELDACPNRRRIVITTAGVAPPGCSAETFRAIGEWIPTLGRAA